MDGGPLPPLSFDDFTFDLSRGALLGVDGVEIPLRPKTMAMLRYLLERPCRLIGREELLEAIWPGVYVSDDSITQCVGEIRKALGESGPRLLKTVPKRGYLFDATVERKLVLDSAVPASLAAALAPLPAVPTSETSHPVATAPRSLRALLLSGGAVLCLLLVAGGAWFWVGTFDGSPRQVAQLNAPNPTPAQEESDRLLVEGRIALRRRVYPDVYGIARELFEKAVQVNPTNVLAHAEIAFTYANMVNYGYSQDRDADLRNAMEAANRAVLLGPDTGLAYIARAAAFRAAGRFEQALADYRRGVALDPEQVRSLGYVGLMLILLGRPEEAIEPLRSAVAKRQNSPSVHDWYTALGLAQLLMGGGDFGASYFRRSLERSGSTILPADARRMHLAAALALSGDIEEARAIVAGVLATNPAMGPSWFREHELSGHVRYLEQRRLFYRGLALTGLTEPATPEGASR